PQVSVQASCVFLRRRAEDELRLVGKNGLKQRPVFMAIAESCGHGRRGEARYVRAPDGTELVVTREGIERRERDGRIDEQKRRKAMKELADDLPWVAEQYRLQSLESGL